MIYQLLPHLTDDILASVCQKQYWQGFTYGALIAGGIGLLLLFVMNSRK